MISLRPGDAARVDLTKTRWAMKLVARIVILFLVLVALAQLLRLVLQVEVVAGGVRVPLWASAVACAVTGGLAYLLWREGHQ